MNMEFAELKISPLPYPLMEERMQKLASNPSPPSESVAVCLRREKPHHPNELQRQAFGLVLQGCNVILHRGSAFHLLKSNLKFMSGSLQYLQTNISPVYRCTSLQPEINELIWEVAVVDKLVEEVKEGGGFYCLCGDDFKNIQRHQILNTGIKFMTASKTFKMQCLGAQLVRGKSATGFEVCAAVLR
jgi:hypothetical protein